MRVISAAEVEALLPIPACIPVVREAMRRFSTDPAPQPLRSVVPIGQAGMFGVMPGRLSGTALFGAKLVSVFAGPDGHQRHQGIVALFDSTDGAPLRFADAEAVTTIRTAAATAVATQALARNDAQHLAIFGTGRQAAAHLTALTASHTYGQVTVWGRSLASAEAFARAHAERLGMLIGASDDARATATTADVICTVTSAHDPVLLGEWLRPGVHVNLVGSSVPGPREADDALVARSRLFVDSRRSAEAQAAEYLHALAAGAIGPGHILGEIGEVIGDRVAGRLHADDITTYKSLGLIVQDLAALAHIHERLNEAPADG